MQRTNIYLSENQIARLDVVAAGRHSSRADVIRELIDEGLASLNDDVDERLAALHASFGALADVEQEPFERKPGERQRHLDEMFRL